MALLKGKETAAPSKLSGPMQIILSFFSWKYLTAHDSCICKTFPTLLKNPHMHDSVKETTFV